MVAHELFIGALSEVQNEVGVAKAERFCDAQQVCILVDVPHVFAFAARLDDSRRGQNYDFGLREE